MTELEDHGPIAEPGRIGARDAVHDELAMLLRVAPRNVDVAQHRRVAIHGEAGIEIANAARAHDEALRFEAGQHGEKSGDGRILPAAGPAVKSRAGSRPGFRIVFANDPAHISP
ncbi:MAG TPA: hypothetical protein VF913_18055 [Xanthobacteraceae bacterium]